MDRSEGLLDKASWDKSTHTGHGGSSSHDPCHPQRTLVLAQNAFQKVGRLFIGDYDHDGLCSQSVANLSTVIARCGLPRRSFIARGRVLHHAAALSCGLFTHMSHELSRFEGWRAHDKERRVENMLSTPQRTKPKRRAWSPNAPNARLHLRRSTSVSTSLSTSRYPKH